ncbi:MAG: hypothetical protein IPP83_12670 [Flavobacteriales bacterium]|nr:hypothetical protein [Flavobacteriales bacterium]
MSIWRCKRKSVIFNQSILYARDVDDTVKDTCLRFPMMAERNLAIVRELNAWRIDQWRNQSPTSRSPHRVPFVLKGHKKIDGRKRS